MISFKYVIKFKINMAKFSKLYNFLLFIIIKFVNCQIYCGINQIKYNITFPKQKIQKISPNTNYRPIQIHLDTTSLSDYIMPSKLNITITALNSTVKMLQKLIKVKELNYKIVINQNDLNKWGISKYSQTLTQGIDTDLIVLVKYIENGNFYMSSEPKYIDENTKRPIVGIIYIYDRFISDVYNKKNRLYYTECLFLHQFIHILGFLYELFRYYPGGINNVISSIESDTRSNIMRSYVITSKVIEYAKKYYGCDNVIGVELEDQDGRLNSHWEARILLGEIMNSDHYLPEQVLSEITLALLEDSGWYQINYYTGGLMRFGKNKGCIFLNGDCLDASLFKNEFSTLDDIVPGCSSGRQSRAYGMYFYASDIDFKNEFEKYNRFQLKKGTFDIADYCLVYNSKSEEERDDGYYVGNCNRGNGGYGTYIAYTGRRYRNSALEEYGLGEKYGDHSFCILSSVSTIEGRINNAFYQFENNLIHPMCYPMFCSERSLTIQINNWFVVCPRGGGKVQVNNTYEGYFFCPDYNLICTGTVICNDLFDCIEKESSIKEETFIYDYEIKTSQIKGELIIAELEPNSYELSDNGKCPKDCEQCNDIKQCFFCRKGFYYIGVNEDELNTPIYCKNISNISIGYYETKDINNNKSIYYPCFTGCDHCNKTHCIKCDNYHKLDENNIYCIEKVKYCGIYENITYTCIKCRDEYAFIGLDRTLCHIINITKYYSIDNGTSYYPCDTNIPHCDECNNSLTCNKCLYPYYFIKDNRSLCFNDKNLSKYFTEDNAISYYPCDTSFGYCDECTSRYECIKCFNNYYLVNDNKGNISCKMIDVNKYYKEGIYYYPCDLNIKNCDECNNKTICNKCITNYYFFKNNRTFCRNDLNLTSNKYYTNDNGISYYPCDTYFNFCEQCLNQTTCKKCINNYGFFINDYSQCIFVGNYKYFNIDNEGITFDFCNNTFPNCDECTNIECTKCYDGFYFIKNNRRQCFNDKNLSQYYTEDNGVSYYPCNESIAHCYLCYNNKTYCNQCEGFNGYYFEENNRNICRNDLNLSKYYTEDNGISYYPCNKEIDYCDECKQKEKCDKCIMNYFFIENNRNKCYNDIDFKKFYTNDSRISYYSCNTSIEYCDECFDQNICNKCYNSYILLYESPIKCYEESLYMNNDNYFKLNDTHYKKCSSSIDKCDKCYSYNNCTKCEHNYYFLNDDHSKCIHENNILPKDEFFKFDNINYYSCSYNNKGINNCKKCTNNTICQRCNQKYGLINNYFNTCISKTELDIGFYHNSDGTIYYPCLENCAKCVNGYECEKCSENFILLNEKTLCQFCENRFENINEEFSDNNINISEYINLNKQSLTSFYVNEVYDYSITIFKIWECTEFLWKKNYFKFNTSALNHQINKILNLKTNDMVYIFTNKNYKNYLEIYNITNGQRIDINKICPECIEIGFEITNNYSINIKKELGITMYNKIKENNINIFDKGDKYISDICQNFSISKIDLTVPDRINYLYIGEYSKEMTCTDKNCEIETNEISNFYGVCTCRVNTDYNYLMSNDIIILNPEDKNKKISYEISLSVVKCIKAGFNMYIFSNTGFYLFGIFIFLQILCFIFFIFFEKQNLVLNPKEKEVLNPNPPKKEETEVEIVVEEDDILFIENFDIIENILNDNNNHYNSVECNEKNVQDKDEGEFIEEINFEEYSYYSNNYDKKSLLTYIKSETESDINLKNKRNKDKDKKKNSIKIESTESKDSFIDKNNNNNNNKNNIYSHKNECSEFNLKFKDIISTNKRKKNETIHYSNTDGNEKITIHKNKLSLRNSIISNEAFIYKRNNLNNKTKKKNVNNTTDNLSLKKAKMKDNLSFCGFYWYLLGLKQPILNLASQIKMFKITESFVPSGIKLIRFIFIVELDFFSNCLFISQKYFSDKFKYFDKKYNLRFEDLGNDISINERFSYSFKHTILYSVYSFIICYVIQSVINFFYFNLRKRINMIIENNKNVQEEFDDYLETVKIKYKFMFMINMILMVFFWYYIINFTGVYHNGDLDYIAASIMTFIFLQIFPFFACLILAIFRHCGLKKSEKNIYKISQVLAY